MEVRILGEKSRQIWRNSWVLVRSGELTNVVDAPGLDGNEVFGNFLLKVL